METSEQRRKRKLKFSNNLKAQKDNQEIRRSEFKENTPKRREEFKSDLREQNNKTLKDYGFKTKEDKPQVKKKSLPNSPVKKKSILMDSPKSAVVKKKIKPKVFKRKRMSPKLKVNTTNDSRQKRLNQLGINEDQLAGLLRKKKEVMVKV